MVYQLTRLHSAEERYDVDNNKNTRVLLLNLGCLFQKRELTVPIIPLNNFAGPYVV
jgi:hypothetical protein